MDETAVYFEMPEKKTIELKGTKKVEINTFGHDKERISVLLAIAGNGNKLPPLLIYKGKEGKFLENKLQKVKEVLDKKILVACQENSWCDQDIFLKWYNEIYLKYEIFQEKKMLINFRLCSKS